MYVNQIKKMQNICACYIVKVGSTFMIGNILNMNGICADIKIQSDLN